MPEMEQQDKTLSEIIVKEAINKGMDSSMRESILEAVEESEGARSGGRLPLAGVLFGLGAAAGYLVGRHAPDLEGSPIEDLEEPEIIEDVVESAEEADEMMAEMDESGTDSTSRLPRLLLAVGVLAGAAFLRRRLSSGEEEEWEPIEEFEPATGGDTDEETESGDEAEAEASADEAEAADEESEE